MSNRFTHTLEVFPPKQERVMIAADRYEMREAPARYVLSRWDTGLIIGMSQGSTCNTIDFAKEKNVTTSYRDDKYALMALRRFADEDAKSECGEVHAFIDEIDRSGKILTPNVSDISAIARPKV